ncbi:hypothetical protein DRN67_01205 [Candidatus Micrarchaeota archaeon]|nr:MAG: hypothetical protein DRN67_01205 [Candidatus Micrarchaeota archaeon]
MVELKIPDMPFIKRKKGKGAAVSKEAKEEGETAEEELRRKIALYRRIIERYREIIEKAETKTVTELRSLIVPNDPVIIKLKDEILEEFRPYIFSKHFEAAARKAYEFVLEEVANEELPVDFWLEPRDIVELRAADEMDKAVLLCSLLRSMECDSAKVIVESNGERHVFVGFSVGKKYFLMDPAHRTIIDGRREDVLMKRFGGGNKQVYEFNDKEYDEIVGGE